MAHLQVKRAGLLLLLGSWLFLIIAHVDHGYAKHEEPAAWQTECVYCPTYFNQLSSRSTQIDSNGRLHIAYGGDYLYYSHQDDAGQWQTAVVDPISNVGRHAMLQLDSTDTPHIIYLDATAQQWGLATRKADFFDAKADLESVLHQVADPREFRFEAAEYPALHPGQSARVLRNGEPIGWIGLLHPGAQKALDVPAGVYLFEVDLEALKMGGIPAFEPLSKFPAIRRDFALLVAREVSYQAVLDCVRDAAPAVVKDIQLFDVYTGENIDSSLKSLALSLILQESSHTLTDLEVEEATRTVLQALADRLAAKLRD